MKKMLFTCLLSIYAVAGFTQTAPQSATSDNGEKVVEYLRSCYTTARSVPPKELLKNATCETLGLKELPEPLVASQVTYVKKRLAIKASFNDGAEIIFDGVKAISAKIPPHSPLTRMRNNVSCWSVDGIISRCCTDNGFCCTWYGGGGASCG